MHPFFSSCGQFYFLAARVRHTEQEEEEGDLWGERGGGERRGRKEGIKHI